MSVEQGVHSQLIASQKASTSCGHKSLCHCQCPLILPKTYYCQPHSEVLVFLASMAFIHCLFFCWDMCYFFYFIFSCVLCTFQFSSFWILISLSLYILGIYFLYRSVMEVDLLPCLWKLLSCTWFFRLSLVFRHLLIFFKLPLIICWSFVMYFI